ncbi:MAG: hypothetical protein J6A56_00980 [Clostridia bacterium]|nr:hypothetical protein [Clostridia bacterium]
MKKWFFVMSLLCIFLLGGCESRSIGIIGGVDGPTAIYVGEDVDTNQVFKKYINERKLPMLDIRIDRENVFGDRTLIVDDSIENEVEYLIYEFYLQTVSGEYGKIYDRIGGEVLKGAVEAEEENFRNGIYFSRVVLDDIDIVDKDDVRGHFREQVAKDVVSFDLDEFAVVEVDKTVKHNEKALSMGPQVGDGELERYYLVGRKDKKDGARIYEIYWGEYYQD